MAKSSITFKRGASGNSGGCSPRIGPNGETAAELRAKGAGDLIGNADEVDATIRALQAILHRERQ
ncbi:hypothetical protein DyAD56_21215 [Dyella sp. AD56]|nr:hypothetical protein DyAD56_21215 [Dyella sp. AD56]